MIRYVPRYLLYVESNSVMLNKDVCQDDCLRTDRLGQWRFILESLDDLGRLEVADEEPGTWGPRLALLATVRGLEALEQPSRVTLIARSRYLNDRLSRLTATATEASSQWELNPWHDRYQNADLWRRVEAALGYHNVECRNWRLDGAHESHGWHVNSQSRPVMAPEANFREQWIGETPTAPPWQRNDSNCLAVA